MPPTAKSDSPRSAIWSCSECRLLPKVGAQRCQISGFLRSVPSPQHGTSQQILVTRRFRRPPPPSHPWVSAGSDWPGCETIASRAAAAPSASQRRTSVYARAGDTSLATTKPVGSTPPLANSASTHCVVFEPGLAHMSSTTSSGCTSSNATGSMLSTAWRMRSPMAPLRTSQSRVSLSTGSLENLSAPESRPSCQPRHHGSSNGASTGRPKSV